MAHPARFNDDDPVLARLRQICLALPGADEKVSHGRPAFFTKKIFAGFGAVLKGEHDSAQYDQALVFMPDPDDAMAIEQDQRFFTPAYWGPYGWRGIDLSNLDVTKDADWVEVAELIEESFRATAPNKLIKELDEQA